MLLATAQVANVPTAEIADAQTLEEALDFDLLATKVVSTHKFTDHFSFILLKDLYVFDGEMHIFKDAWKTVKTSGEYAARRATRA